MSRSALRVLGALLVALISAGPLAAETVAGHTAGQFQVSETGAATYTVPITAVPGTSGLEPKLALAYGSQGRNGLLGVGWSLSGLSVISRCPATLAQDGLIDGVDFDEHDRFCLDGERLMAVSGNYGADGTEYRTEQDTFRRVISYGEAGSGPEFFTAQTKSGLILEYGGTEDSRIEAQGKASILFWAVNRIADTKGNYLTVTYTEDNAGGEYRPDRIDYTGNDAAGLASFASVRFSYESRPDVTPRYVGGAVLKTTQRLAVVRAYEGEHLYREYLLAYGTGPSTGRSRLESLTECGSDGTCFAPTVFEWQEGSDGTFGTQIYSGGATHINWGSYQTTLGDFNGDGLTDFLAYVNNGTNLYMRVKLANGDRTFGDQIYSLGETHINWGEYRTAFGDFTATA